MAEGHPGRLARGATAVGAGAGSRWRRPSGRDVQGFFEPRPRGPGRPRPPDRQPIWLGPPEDSFGVLVPLQLVLVRTADLAVAIPGATAYRTGFGFDLAIRRAAAKDDAFALDRTLHWLGRKGSPPPELLRVGCSSPTVRRPPVWTLGGTTLTRRAGPRRRHLGRCCCRLAVGVASASGASPIGCGRCRLMGHSPSLSSGPRWVCR